MHERREDYRECAYACIRIDERFILAKIKAVADQPHEALSLGGVRLEEGRAGDSKAATQNLLVVEALTGLNRRFDCF